MVTGSKVLSLIIIVSILYKEVCHKPTMPKHINVSIFVTGLGRNVSNERNVMETFNLPTATERSLFVVIIIALVNWGGQCEELYGLRALVIVVTRCFLCLH